MKTMKHVGLALLALLSALTVQAASPTTTLLKTRASYSAAVTTGKWQSNFYKAKKYATDNKLPFIAVWSNGDSCGHCDMFEESVNSSYFRKWMANSGMVFYFTYYGDKGDGTTKKSGKKADNGAVASDIFHWCRKNTQTSYPFVRIYWPAGNVDISTVGDKVDGKKDGTTGGKKAAAFFASKLSKFKPTPVVVVPKYTGGTFGVGDTEADRLEAELVVPAPGVTNVTSSVDVPIVRTNATVVTSVSTNILHAVYPNGAITTNTIYWASGESATNVTVDVGSKVTSTNAPIELILLDAAGAGVATNHITIVSGLENSPKNPLWIGEKTVHDLNWGEWTMDLDVATNKVNVYNAGSGETTSGGGASLLSAASPKDRAYTLLLLEGALWCPDCKYTEANLFMQDKFKTWAQENKVACVALDLSCGTTGDDPTATAPTLLTDEAMFGISGASYLSRKMIDKDAAADVLDRNWELAQKLRLPSASKKYRPPVPSIFVLRNDGTVAGRIEYFGSKSPTDASNIDAHIKRLNELLRQVDEPEEEANDVAATTMEMIGPRTNVVDKTVSFTDAADVYRLDPALTANKRLVFTLKGTNVVLQLKLVADGETLATASGLADEGVSVEADVKSTNCYVSVSYPADETHFAVASTNSTLSTYTLKSDFVVQPTELAADNHIVIEDGVNRVTVSLVSNQLYRITNLDTANAENLAALMSTNGPGTADSLYLAQVTDDVPLTLTGPETYIQRWNPGTVGFVISSASTLESAPSYTIRLARSGGASGRATAQVAFNADTSSGYKDLFSLPDGFGDELVWEEGDTEEKTLKVTIVENTFADGDQHLYFDAALAGDAAPGIAQFRLSLRDNDKRVPGKIALTGTTPAMAKDMMTYARAGTDVTIELTRVDGTTGKQVVTLAASGGALSETSFSWSNRVTAAETATLSLPSETGKVKVTMTPEKGSAVDGNRRILTVNVLDADVPGFEVDDKRLSATRYLPMAETRIALDDKATDVTTVKKYSGALPQGVKWAFDADAKELVVSGVPTAAGSFTAVFRAVGPKDGLTVAVTVDVADPVTSGGGEGGQEPLNAAVATSRTFADIPVFDTTTNRLVGVLTLTLPRNGRASAKYRGVDIGTVTLSCPWWSAIDAGGTLTAELVGKTAEGADCTMTVRARADGKVEVDFKDPMTAEHDFSVLLPGTVWSNKNPATDFKGYYTVSLPLKKVVSGTPFANGAGYATLKMNTAAAINAGKFAYAGVLPDGRAFSGSAVATPDEWRETVNTSFWFRAVVPVVTVGSLNVFSGAFQITPGAFDATATNMVQEGLCAGRCFYRSIRRSVAPAKEADLFWRHIEKATNACYEAALDAYGTYYVATENFASCCAAVFQSTPLKFYVQDEGEGDSAAWPTNGAPTVTVKYASKTKINSIAVAKNTRGLTLTFTPSTGIVSGAFTLGGEKMTYKGVVMPGWGSDSCTACGFVTDYPGGADAQLRPFISGTAWFNDDIEYEDVNGKSQTLSVRSGCPFSIGTQTAK